MNDVADELLDEMDQMWPRVDDALAELEARRATIDTQIARIKAFKKIMEGPETKPRRGSSGKGLKRKSDIAPERLELIVRTILATDREKFTIHDIHTILEPGWSSSATAQVFRYLRLIEFVGKMGLERGTHRQLWKVTNRAAVEGLV